MQCCRIVKLSINKLIYLKDIPLRNISAKKLTAENLNIELGGGELPPAAGLPAESKLKIFNQATLPQTIQYWLVVVLSLGSIISYVATTLSSFGLLTPNCNCTSTPK